MASPVVAFRRLSEDATLPTRATPGSAGLDLYSTVNMIICAKDSGLVPLDLQVLLPENCYGRIAPRSGLAAHFKIDVLAGVIDRDYTGPLTCVLFNHGEKDFPVCKGQRIAQLICEKCVYPNTIVEDKTNITTADSKSIMPDDSRGKCGFGSSGNF